MLVSLSDYLLFRFRWKQPFVYSSHLFSPRFWNIKPTTDVNVGDCIHSDDMVKNVKLTYDNGFQIGSHTWSHPHLASLTRDQGE